MDNPDLKILMKHIGAIVKLHRKKKKLTQGKLGKKVGLSSTHIGRIERAEGNPGTKTLHSFAVFFGIHVKEFFDVHKQGNLTNQNS